MKKKLIALLLTFVLTFAFSINCFALQSPTEPVITTKETTMTVTPGSNGSFDTNIKIDEDAKIYVDGKVVDPSNYTIGPDGKTLVLSEDYLASLSAGSHTILIENPDGTSGSATFKLTKSGEVVTTAPTNNSSTSPKTADMNNYLLFGSLFLIAGSCMVIMVSNKKRLTR